MDAERLAEIHAGAHTGALTGPLTVLDLVAHIDKLTSEVERMHSWDGLMSLLDEHWPEDVFPTLLDDDTRDEGPRIVSLLRWVDRLRKAAYGQLTKRERTDLAAVYGFEAGLAEGEAEREQLTAERDRARDIAVAAGAAELAAVRELHREVEPAWCDQCTTSWPCQTIRAIGGGQ